MSKKIIWLRKFFSIFTSFNLILQSLFGTLLWNPKFVFAQDVTPTPVEEQQITPSPEPVVTPAEPTPTIVEATPTPSDTSGQAVEPTPTIEPILDSIVTPTPEITVTPEPTGQILPEAASTDVPNIEILPVPTPSPVVVEKECLADGQVIKDTVNEDWNIDTEKGLAETKEKVKLGVKYNFPLENKVSVTFKCLPKDESLRTSLKIQQVKVSDLKLPEGTNPAGEYAYDITTGMEDGTFEYDVTLPKTEGQIAEVSYIEKSVNEVKENEINSSEIKQIEGNKVEQANEIVKATSIDHFTIYFVESYTDDTYITVDDNFYRGETVYAKATRDTAANMRLRFRNPSNQERGTCSYSNSTVVYCEYTLPNNAPYGEWDVQIGRCDNDCNHSDNWTWNGFGEDHFNVSPVPSTTPSNSTTISGNCMADAANEQTLNCTANDISIANVTLLGILDDGCQSPNDTVTFKARWNVQATANQRYDIGLYFASEGQNDALHGTCSVTTLANSPVPPWFNFDGDACGDLSNSSPVNPEITMTVKCLDPNGNNFLDVPYCTSWDNNSNTTCNSPTDAIPGTGSKCSCNTGFQVPITVPFGAKIEVVKSLSPITDPGTFNLQIDGVNNASCVSNNGTTGSVSVGAGTSETPGADHTVGETVTGCGSTDLSKYTSTISCVDRGLTTFHNGPALTQSGTGPLTVHTVKDDDIVCTITNSVPLAHLTLIKTVTNDNGGSALPTAWTLNAIGSTNISGVTGNVIVTNAAVNPETYTLSETNGPSGYLPGSWSCVKNSDQAVESNSIVLSGGDNATCTINNDDQAGTLIVKKELKNDNGGNKVCSDFSFSYNAAGATAFETDCQNEISVPAGTYTVTEPSVTGCLTTYNNCTGVSVVNGGTTTCTITNDDIQPKLTVTKVVVGSTESVDSFNLFVDSTPIVSGQENGFDAGSYTVSETVNNDYNSEITGDCAPNGTITLQPGDVEACTITNTRKQGNVTFIKNVTIGNEPPSSWTFDVYQGGQLVGTYNHAESVSLDTGSYTVVENGPGSYFLDSIGGTACSAGALAGIANLTVTENGGTCQFGNSQKATITINKVVDPSVSTDTFDFTVTTLPADYTGSVTLGDGGTHTFIDLMPGNYNIVETINPNYSVGIFCNGIPGGAGANVFMKTLSAGEDLVCTFTNTRKQGKIELQKDFVGTPENVTIKIGSTLGGSSVESKTLSADGATSEHMVDTGTYYVSETLTTPANYNTLLECFNDIDNSNTVNTGDTTHTVTSGAVVVAENDDVICRYTNTRKTGTVIVKKVMVGGTGTFNYTGSPNGSISTNNGTIQATVDTGQYLSVESIATGWDLNSIVCDDGNPPVGGNSTGDVATRTATFNVEAGETVTCTFTNTLRTGVISGLKWRDLDGSGTQNLTGEGLSGWTMNLFRKDADGNYDPNNPIASRVSGDDFTTGGFRFANLPFGEYEICEVSQQGWYSVNPSNLCQSVSLDDQNRTPFIYFENAQYGSISGYKWEDVNANGIWDAGEPALSGWQIFIDSNKNYQYDAGEPTATTDANAYYEFTVLPGEYWIFETMQAGWQQQVPYYTLGHSYFIINVTAGQTYSDNNFGNYRLAHIEGDKWNDLNGNGVRDAGEPTIFLSGLRYRVYKEVSPGVYSQVVDGPFESSHYGEYVWVAPGTYWVTEYSIPAGWTQTHPDSNAPTAWGMRLLGPITLLSGESSSNNDLGNTQYGSISLGKCNDINGDGGECDGSEPMLPGWTLFLDENSNGVLDSGERSGVTNNDGMVYFTDVLPRNYGLCEVEQTGWVRTKPQQSNCHTIALDPGGSIAFYFANFKPGSIHGYKWDDQNGNGERDCIEQGNGGDIFGERIFQICNEWEPLLSGWTINVYKSNGDGGYDLNPIRSMVTDNGTEHFGWYWFEDLLPGQYKVCEALQGGWNQTYPINGDDNCHVVSLPDDNFNEFPTSENYLAGHEYNFGNFELGKIHGYKYSDDNDNGIWDPSEKGIKDWEICLEKQSSLFQVAAPGALGALIEKDCHKTDANGHFEFTGLTWGDYELSEEHRVGWTQTEPKDLATYKVIINSGTGLVDGHEYNFGNASPIKLTLEKSNDKSVAHAGDTVTYTLTTTVGPHTLTAMTLIDNSPDGFVYQTGTATVVGGTVNSVEPTLTNSGKTLTWTWTAVPGSSTVTVTYQVKIDSGNQAASYTNYAYVYGSGSPEVGIDEIVFSEVRIDPDISPSAQAGGEVLGAATELPASGSSTWYLIFALSLIGAGLVIKRFSRKLN